MRALPERVRGALERHGARVVREDTLGRHDARVPRKGAGGALERHGARTPKAGVFS